MTYKAVWRSIINYAAPAWSTNIRDTNHRNIQYTQNETLRIATGCHKMSSVDHLHVEVIGKGCSKKQSWITNEILALCDERRKLRKHMKETHSVADEYRKCNKTIRKAMKAAKEQWIDDKCTAIEDNLTKHNGLFKCCLKNFLFFNDITFRIL